jgi:hypothetical protein
MAGDIGLLITGGSDFHGPERSGYKINKWVHKTNIPYDLVTAIKKNAKKL